MEAGLEGVLIRKVVLAHFGGRFGEWFGFFKYYGESWGYPNEYLSFILRRSPSPGRVLFM